MLGQIEESNDRTNCLKLKSKPRQGVGVIRGLRPHDSMLRHDVGPPQMTSKGCTLITRRKRDPLATHALRDTQQPKVDMTLRQRRLTHPPLLHGRLDPRPLKDETLADFQIVFSVSNLRAKFLHQICVCRCYCCVCRCCCVCRGSGVCMCRCYCCMCRCYYCMCRCYCCCCFNA